MAPSTGVPTADAAKASKAPTITTRTDSADNTFAIQLYSINRVGPRSVERSPRKQTAAAKVAQLLNEAGNQLLIQKTTTRTKDTAFNRVSAPHYSVLNLGYPHNFRILPEHTVQGRLRPGSNGSPTRREADFRCPSEGVRQNHEKRTSAQRQKIAPSRSRFDAAHCQINPYVPRFPNCATNAWPVHSSCISKGSEKPSIRVPSKVRNTAIPSRRSSVV